MNTGRSVRVTIAMLALLTFLMSGCTVVSPVAGSTTLTGIAATTDPVATSSIATTLSIATTASKASETPSASTGSAALPTAALPTAAASTTAPATSAVTTPKPTPAATPSPATCTISVVCHTAVAYGSKIAPPGGVILAPASVPLQAGDTVLSVLVRAISAANPRLRGGNVRVVGGAYISGIGNDAMADMLYEKDCGPESGWLFYIGGAYIGDGASRRIVQAGETIEWKYTCASGRDLR
jgi:hypothetical protein